MSTVDLINVADWAVANGHDDLASRKWIWYSFYSFLAYNFRFWTVVVVSKVRKSGGLIDPESNLARRQKFADFKQKTLELSYKNFESFSPVTTCFHDLVNIIIILMYARFILIYVACILLIISYSTLSGILLVMKLRLSGVIYVHDYFCSKVCVCSL